MCTVLAFRRIVARSTPKKKTIKTKPQCPRPRYWILKSSTNEPKKQFRKVIVFLDAADTPIQYNTWYCGLFFHDVCRVWCRFLFLACSPVEAGSLSLLKVARETTQIRGRSYTQKRLAAGRCGGATCLGSPLPRSTLRCCSIILYHALISIAGLSHTTQVTLYLTDTQLL